MDPTQRPPMDATQRLPSELLLRVFDFFAHGDSPRDFVRAPGRVCARWRRLARAHPSFYRDIWLERDLGPSALGLCQAQLDAGAGADVDLTIVHPDEIACVVPLLLENLHRCASLHVEYYGAPREVRALLDALAARAAPRLRRLHLRVEPVAEEEAEDSADYGGPASEALAFPADIFRGSAPRLTRLELCGAVCMMLPTAPSPVPAFSLVTSLEIHAYAFGPHAVVRALTAAPGTRHLEVLAVKHGTGPWPPVRLPPSLQLQLEKVLFSALDGAWDDLLHALDAYALPEFAVLCGMPARYVAAYARHSLPAPAPLELAVCDSTRLGLAHTDAVLSAPSLNRSLRLVDSLSTNRLSPYADRIVRLEVPSSEWPGPAAVSLPQLATLVLHVMADRLRPACAACCRVGCPRLREMKLLLGGRAPPEAFRVKADHVAYFVRDRLGLEAGAGAGLLEVSVARPLVLVGRRSWLAATVGSVSEV